MNTVRAFLVTMMFVGGCMNAVRPGIRQAQYEQAVIAIGLSDLRWLVEDDPRDAEQRILVHDSLVSAAAAFVFTDIVSGEQELTPGSSDERRKSRYRQVAQSELELRGDTRGVFESALPRVADDPDPTLLVYFARRGDSLLLAEVVRYSPDRPPDWGTQTEWKASAMFLWRVTPHGYLSGPMIRRLHR